VANKVYPLWKKAVMAEADVNDTLDQAGANACYVALVTIGSGGYVYSDNHQFYPDVTNIQATPQPLLNPVLTANVFKADGVLYTAVTGTTIGALVIYRSNTGANTSWRLVLYEDTGITGFPMVPNGGNVLVSWNTQGIFAL
jgi:hypothetical protein